MNNYFHEHIGHLALLEELPLGKDCTILFYIQTCYFATVLPELSYSYYYFSRSQNKCKPNRCNVFTRMALARISPLTPSLCCWFIIRVINVTNSPCLATKFSIKIVMRVFRSCFLDSRMSLESLIQI